MLNIKLQNLPPYGKLFVGLVTALMLCICFWSVFIFYVDKGLLEDGDKPLYMQDESSKQEVEVFANKTEHLRHNVGLAHTHINGQTLLFFVLGFLFLFSSAKEKIKKILLWLFALVIFCHAVGLSGDRFHWFFDDLLAVSGVGLLILIPYISFLIIVDLFKEAEK